MPAVHCVLRALPLLPPVGEWLAGQRRFLLAQARGQLTFGSHFALFGVVDRACLLGQGLLFRLLLAGQGLVHLREVGQRLLQAGVLAQLLPPDGQLFAQLAALDLLFEKIVQALLLGLALLKVLQRLLAICFRVGWPNVEIKQVSKAQAINFWTETNAPTRLM